MMNGLTSTELNRRAKPLLRSQDSGLNEPLYVDAQEQPRDGSASEAEFAALMRSTRTVTGWIGEHEELAEVLERDRKTVEEELQASHALMAEVLKVLVETRQGEGSGAAHQRSLTFRASVDVRGQLGERGWKQLPRAFMPPLPSGGTSPVVGDATSSSSSSSSPAPVPMFEIAHLETGGFQHSLFCNFEQDLEEDAWSDEYRIMCREVRGVQLRIAGNLAHGAINLIERFGFYESGDDNPFRIDPCIIAAFAAGAHNTWSRQLTVERTERSLRLLRDRAATLGQRIAAKASDLETAQSTAADARRVLEQALAGTLDTFISPEELEDAGVAVNAADTAAGELRRFRGELAEVTSRQKVLAGLLEHLLGLQIPE